jgi:hypothetical protein
MWEDNTKMNLKEIRCEGIEWIQLSHDDVHFWASEWRTQGGSIWKQCVKGNIWI